MGETRGLIPNFDGKAGRGCCCNSPFCKYLADDFRSLNDIRGSCAPFPFVIDGGPDSIDRTLKKRKAALFRLHLGVAESVRITKNTSVAWHHFDPVAIKCLAYDMKKKKYNCPDVISGFFVKNFIKNEYYNDGDKFGTKNDYYFVPTYPYELALEDYNKLLPPPPIISRPPTPNCEWKRSH
jgi:hypothetical protein